MKKIELTPFFLIFIFSFAFAFAEPEPEEILSRVKENTDKIKSFKAKIIQKDAETGEVRFTGNIFFKRPQVRVDFTGPDEFEGAGLSAIRTADGSVVTVDEDGYELTATGAACCGDFFDYITGDITDFGKAEVEVIPAYDLNTGSEARFYIVRVRMPEEGGDELDAARQQDEFMKQVFKKGNLSGDDYSAWQDYSKKARRPTGQPGSVFWQKDTDMLVDYKSAVIKEISVLLDGCVSENTKYEYTYAGGKYIPSKVIYDDGETRMKMQLSAIQPDVFISEKIFAYKKVSSASPADDFSR